jgi:hypothetical protein
MTGVLTRPETPRQFQVWLSYVAFLVYFLLVIVPVGRVVYWLALGTPGRVEQHSAQAWLLIVAANVLLTIGTVVGVFNIRTRGAWSPWRRTALMCMLFLIGSALFVISGLV